MWRKRTAKVDDKTVTRRFSQTEAEFYQRWIVNKQLRAVIAQMGQLASQAH